MKANDVFIISAIGMELINTFIWIKPSWTNRHYLNQTMAVGVTDEFKETYGTQLCVCEDFEKKKKSKTRSKEECEVLHPKREGSKSVDITKCSIKAQYRYYEVSEKYAIKLLNAIRKKEKNQPSVILDIDEDYFGVENRMKAYRKNGGQNDDIWVIDKAASKVFCPKTGGDAENRANEFMLEYMQKILTQCYAGRQKCNENNVLEIGDEMRNKLNDNLRKKLFCSIEDFQSEFSNLAHTLWSFSETALKGFLKLKFCNFGIPALGFGEKFGTCKGIPDNGATENHMPDNTEIQDRANKLNNIVSFIFEKYAVPGVTTICRSMRDGYTPSNYFQSIEKYITDGLRNATAHKNDLSFHYDDKLLFGSPGWITE